MEATTPGYPTRLSDAQWEILAVYFAADSPLGRPRKTNLRAVVEAILYVLRAGCPWRMLPSDFPPWQTVYGYFRRWRDNGTWQRIHRYLR
ncbi:MAG: IS5/IS1182 family transposase, partial [Cyanobacteria bacterium QH_7_48_89]